MAYHPSTLFVTMIWIGYISGMLFLLERAAENATKVYPQEWWLDWVPSVLLTGFAQGHVAITAMHLARLAVSALQNPSTSPNSWAELFWLADRNWQGPVGLGATVYGKAKLGGISLSSTFILFTVTCLFALPTPIVISRAYPLRTVEVMQRTNIALSTFAPSEMPNFDVFTQLGTGSGAWATGLSVLDIYNSSVFTPIGYNAVEQVDDFVFAGEVSSYILVLPVIRVSGGCEVMAGAEQAPAEDVKLFEWCKDHVDDLQYWDEFHLTGAWNTDVAAGWCTNFNYNYSDWMNNAPSFDATAIIWVNATDTVTPVSGLVQCNASFATGYAQVNGLDGTYTAFTQQAYFDVSDIRQDIAFVHPLFAALYDISQTFVGQGETYTERAASVLRMMGYVPSYDAADGKTRFKQPSLDEFAQQIWRGTAHMGAAVGLLARRADEPHAAWEVRSVSGRKRDYRFILGALALLAGWLCMLLYCTSRMFRPTFGDNLDSYVAARLLADVPYLVREHCCGELSNNRNLQTQFKRVGDAGPQHAVGHVASGGVGMLVTGRYYGRYAVAETGA